MQLDQKFAQQLPELCSQIVPVPLDGCQLQIVNSALAKQLSAESLLADTDAILHALCSENGVFKQGSIAQKYGGHQFGHWNPELGDGRGLLLGEIKGMDNQWWDLHLKGAGSTPYSRQGDGKAVLRSTIREYLASEALHHMGIPTSRALALLSSHEPVYREKQEFGAQMIRVCQSHLRFGHFEYFYHSKQTDKLEQLFNYTFEHHFSDLRELPNPHLSLLGKIVRDTALMIAKWQAQGFCHGVMNTDNMSIHGITFDFGPYAFLDTYESDYICNHSDHQGRYAFDQQPGVALWNLNALAHAFTPYVSVEDIKQVLQTYQPLLMEEYADIMRKKLGLASSQDNDSELLSDWLNLLEHNQQDYHLSFQLLSRLGQELDVTEFANHFIDRQKAIIWAESYTARQLATPHSAQDRLLQMQKVNPVYVLRNYQAQLAIDKAEEGDYTYLNTLIKVLEKPFTQQAGMDKFAEAPPDWGQKMEISCSS